MIIAYTPTYGRVQPFKSPFPRNFMGDVHSALVLILIKGRRQQKWEWESDFQIMEFAGKYYLFFFFFFSVANNIIVFCVPPQKKIAAGRDPCMKFSNFEKIQVITSDILLEVSNFESQKMSQMKSLNILILLYKRNQLQDMHPTNKMMTCHLTLF